MTLVTMTIPDDPAELPRWLERRLVAPDFGQFIAELLAHFPVTAEVVQPRHLVDRWLSVALEEGLAPIPPEALSELLRHPAVLVAFQESVIIDGGAYWDDLLDTSDDLSERLKRSRLSLARVLASDAPTACGTVTPKAILKPVVPVAVKWTGARWYKTWAMFSTCVAACLAMAVVWLANSRPADPPPLKSQLAWGWAKAGGLAAEQTSPRDYLNSLATTAEEWSQYQPGDANGVSTRILELRLGCVRLMHSSYGPLSPDDKTWLLEHCREWAKTLDRHQQALDAGADPLALRAAVDETVREIAATLRARAKLVG